MVQSTPSTAILSPEDLISQLDAIQIISAMWSGDGELRMDDTDAEAVKKLVEYVNLPISTLGDSKSVKLKDSLPSFITLILLVSPERGLDPDPDPDPDSEALQTLSISDSKESKRKERTLLLSVSLPLRSSSSSSDLSASKSTSTDNDNRSTKPIIKLQSQGLNWLNRSEQDILTELLQSKPSKKEEEEDLDAAGIVLKKVEDLSEKVIEILKESKNKNESKLIDGNEKDSNNDLEARQSNGELSKIVLRTWHYLPSLSTKSKRDELVSYAKEHVPELTGFVLAGKPGLVVLEHPLPEEKSKSTESLKLASLSLSKYWNSIKSISWADIPPGHKKVSETLREEFVERVFKEMKEMTGSEEFGGKDAIKGERNNRNDLSLVEKWLGSLGIGDRLEGVLGADWKS